MRHISESLSRFFEVLKKRQPVPPCFALRIEGVLRLKVDAHNLSASLRDFFGWRRKLVFVVLDKEGDGYIVLFGTFEGATEWVSQQRRPDRYRIEKRLLSDMFGDRDE